MIERTRISTKKMRDVEWKCVYSYVGVNTGFKTYASDAIPGLTITYEKTGPKRTRTVYTIIVEVMSGKATRTIAKTESPSQAVRIYNAQIEKARGGRPPAGSPKQAGPAPGGTDL